MFNIKNDNRRVFFVDLDGTIVKHNYTDDNDYLLENSLAVLKHLIQQGCALVLTTARTEKNCRAVLDFLKKEGIIFEGAVFDLPTGKRILINDYKNVNEQKAFAMNIERDKGMYLDDVQYFLEVQ